MKTVEPCSKCGLPHGKRRGPKVYRYDGLCPVCGKRPKKKTHRYCRVCRNAYERGHRRKHRELPRGARAKANARAYTHVYVKRGHLSRLRCAICGDGPADAHHPDHSKPLLVIWLCKRHHQEIHRLSKQLRELIETYFVDRSNV